MGTCGLIGFKYGDERQASYNHYDSYPGELGLSIVRFILGLTPDELEIMTQHVTDLTWVDVKDEAPPDLQREYTRAGFCDLDVSNKSPADWYCLLRKAQGAECLEPILEGALRHMILTTREPRMPFEYSYIIDFRFEELEIWIGAEMQGVLGFHELTEDYMMDLQKTIYDNEE